MVRLRGDPDGDQGSLSGSRLVVAVPLSDVHSTLDRLALLELLIGLAVLAAVAAAAYLLVRHELRPLRRIEDTAPRSRPATSPSAWRRPTRGQRWAASAGR